MIKFDDILGKDPLVNKLAELQRHVKTMDDDEGKLSSNISQVLSSLKNEVNNAINTAYDIGKSEKIENELESIISELHLDHIEVNVFIDSIGGKRLTPTFINPSNILTIHSMGHEEVGGELHPKSLVRLSSGDEIKVAVNARDLSIYISKLMNPNAFRDSLGNDEDEDDEAVY